MTIDFDEVRERQEALGPVSTKEKRVVVWLVIAIALWLTESITGFNIGFVTLIVGAAMALPVIGEVLTPSTWNSVPINTLVFLTAAMGIGTVGSATGMNQWIANVVLPSSVPSNIFVLALLIAAITVIIHMFMGSVMAVLGICVPAFLAFTSGTSISPIAVSMMVFSAINIHYILPFPQPCDPGWRGRGRRRLQLQGGHAHGIPSPSWSSSSCSWRPPGSMLGLM